MSTGILRIAVTLLREPLRPAQGDVEDLLALDHLGQRLAADGRLDRRSCTSATLTPQRLHFSRIDAESPGSAGP